MPPPRLVIVPDAPPPAETRWQGDDATFFHRRQIQLGTRLVCMGRIDHGSLWVVQEIRTWPHGATRYRKVDVVERLNDDVVLRNVFRQDTRRARFAALSYSAIWRLAD